jgi:hypothetical protein
MAMQISGVTIQGGMNILPAGGSPSPSPAPTPAPSDPNFSNVVFLFDGDGTNGADNNTFTDSSTNGFTVTESGSVIQGSFSPYGDNWSNYFDGNDHLNTTAVVFGTNNFTIEAWVMFDDASASQNPIIVLGNDGYNDWQLDTHTSNIRFQHTSGSFSGSTTLQDNTWYHVAVVREGTGTNQIKIYLNGALEATSTVSENFDGTGDIKIARNRGNSYYMSGYVSNVRLVNGTAVYTSTFTPSTSPLTAITNTELLTCQSNRFIDNSSSGHTITVNGTPKVTPFSPFKDSDARSLATDGGSAYFDISNQSYLSYAGGSSTVGDITVSGWVYVDQSTGVNNGLYPRVFASGGTQFLVYLRDGAFRVYNGGEVLGAGIHSNTWYHFVVQRTSGTFELWLNGESQGTGSNSTNINLNTTNYVGTDPSGGFYGGYLTDLKVTEASEGYSGNFTPPTAPLTAIANTELLLNFQDAAIFDYSGINNIDTIGAQITTAVKKFGTGSVEFNGTGDELLVYEENSSLTFGTGDFTVEFWVYWNSVSGVQDLLDWRNVGGDQGNYITLYNSGSTLYFFRGTNLLNGTVTSATWHHIALTREDSVTRLFIDGTQTGSDLSDSTSYLTTQGGYMSVGGLNGSVSLDGYIDDLRITKGVARYTSNFTAPTAAFPTS